MRVMLKVGEMIGEDNLVEGSVGPEETPKVPWDMYSKTTPKTAEEPPPVESDDKYKGYYPASTFQNQG